MWPGRSTSENGRISVKCSHCVHIGGVGFFVGGVFVASLVIWTKYSLAMREHQILRCTGLVAYRIRSGPNLPAPPVMWTKSMIVDVTRRIMANAHSQAKLKCLRRSTVSVLSHPCCDVEVGFLQCPLNGQWIHILHNVLAAPNNIRASAEA